MKHENTRALEVQVSAPNEIPQNSEQPLAEWFDDLLGDLQEDENYWFDAAKDDVATQVCQVMERHGVRKADLARRLEKSPTYVTKVLKGTNNFTLDSLVSMARALDCRLEVRFVETQTETEQDDQQADAETAGFGAVTSWNGVERRVAAHVDSSHDWSGKERWKNVLPFPISRNFRQVASRELQPQNVAARDDAEEMIEDDCIPLAA